MANSRLVFSLLVLGVIQCLASTEVPVFMWGNLATNEDVKSNPLQKISAKDFETVAKSALRDNPITLIFIDETLSVEDFSLKNSEGDSSFPYLQANIGRALYLPSVESPLQELEKLADPERSNHIELSQNGLSAEIKPESGRFVFINLKDTDDEESRAELLRRHNDLIQATFTNLLEKNDHVVAFYTAQFPSWTVPESLNRVRREVSNTTSTSFHHNYQFDNLLLQVANMTLYVDGKLVNVSSLTANSAILNGTELNQTLQFSDTQITLHFNSDNGYWFFKSVTVSQGDPQTFLEDLSVTSDVYALTNYSYRCGQNVFFSTVNQTRNANLTLHNLKIQPFIQQLNSSNLTFGEQFDCVGFFTVPIWSGLFVVFILLLITFYGIMMMLDIRTNDRFDDPKGKTITINAGE